jgi:DNA-binding IclR family transcriptional regulator
VSVGDKERALEVLSRSRGLTTAQRLVVMTYALSQANRAGTVERTAKDLAEVVGMTPTQFSRIRNQLVEAGWLEQSGQFAHIKHFRLAQTALGGSNVVQMRRAM